MVFFILKDVFRIFIDPGRFDLFNFFKVKSNNPNEGILHHINAGGLKGAFNFLKNQPVPLFFAFFLILIFNIIKAIGFVWFWIKNYKKANFVVLTILFIMVYFVALTGPLGASRFFVPILPAYLMFASIGFVDLISRVNKKS